jgi:transcriptional regulator with XRE-family HTH domain
VDDDLHRLVAARIRGLAEARHLPLTHLADRAGVSRKQLWNVLNRDASPTLAWLSKIAAVLEVSILDLLRNETETVSSHTRNNRA